MQITKKCKHTPGHNVDRKSWSQILPKIKKMISFKKVIRDLFMYLWVKIFLIDGWSRISALFILYPLLKYRIKTYLTVQNTVLNLPGKNDTDVVHQISTTWL